jgi:3-methyladenine DNA glycosylase AlkC
MPAGKRTAEPFKNRINEALYRQIAKDLSAIEPTFDQKKFLVLTLDGLDQRELMDRVRQTAIALDAALPGTYLEKLEVVHKIASRSEQGLVAFSFCDFVARHGLDHFDASMEALKFFTTLGSAEFAVRPFIARDPARALALMQTWAQDKNEHVRRLASEGSRPRLPWGARLTAIVAKPDLTAPILEILRADPALYVRKSVANHLNDIAKDHPEWVLDRVESWKNSDVGTTWIIRHALRTLIKKGHPRALAFLGADTKAAASVQVRRFTVFPAKIKLGESIELTAELTAKGKKPLPLVIDYVVHYSRAGEKTSAKVFKWSESTVAPGTPLVLKKRQIIRDFTTRKHHAGKHRVELQVNGKRLAETEFKLTT